MVKDDFTFDAERYEADRFIGEVISAEYGTFTRNKRVNPADPNDTRTEPREVKGVQVEIENLSRSMPFNWVETYEDKTGALSKITRFQRACQALGLKSLKAFATARFFEFERKREISGVGKDGRDIVVIFNRPIRIIAQQEAEEAKAARDQSVEAEEATEVVEEAPEPAPKAASKSAVARPAAKPKAEAEEELSYTEAYLIDLIKASPMTQKALAARAEEDPVISADEDFASALDNGSLVDGLVKRGLLKVVGNKLIAV